MLGKDIFLSYASADRDRVRPLVGVLEGNGWTVFWDRTIPAGKAWREVVGKELENCRSVVVVWSQGSIESDWVQEEADRGRRRGILVPVRIDDVEPPLGFGAIQAADLFDWDGQSSAPQSQRFVRDLSTLLGEPPITKAADEGRDNKTAAAEPRLVEARAARETEEDRRPVVEQPRLEEKRKQAAKQARQARQDGDRLAAAEKTRREQHKRDRLQVERSRGPLFKDSQNPDSRPLRRMAITLATVGLVIIASVLYWASRPKQSNPSFGSADTPFDPDEPRVELLLQVKTADGQVVASVEHTIRERLGELGLPKFGLGRPEARSAQLRVLLPREVDVDRVKRVIQSTDLLELRLVEQGPAPSKEALLASAGQLPQHLEVLPGIGETRDGNPSTVYYLLQKTPVITGGDVRNARPALDENNRPAISFSLNQEGGRKLAKATGENIGRHLAIVLDGQVRSAPVIEGPITSDGRITGSFTQQETQDLSLILRSGALAAPVTLIEQRSVEGRPGR